MRHLSLVFITCLLLGEGLHSQPADALAAFAAETFTSQDGHVLPYRVLWPKKYRKNGKKRYPLVLFLHGAGERGDDNAKQLIHGTAQFLDQQNRRQFPAIIIMPQCATDDYWAQMEKKSNSERYYHFDERPNPSLQAVTELLDQLMAEEAVDLDRVYLMGLSMGGMGTFELLARRPQTFAAAVPICGGTNPALVPLYAEQVPLWIFHGADDTVVPVENSRRIVRRYAKLSVPVQYTEYEGIQHNSWDPAFAEKELLPWLFAQKRK